MSRSHWIVMLALVLGACAPHQLYRSDFANVCAAADPAQNCRKKALQDVTDPGNPDGNYLLSFVEFDDQGQLWDRAQMDAVITKLNERVFENDALILVFVHGWKHSAAYDPEDGNITTFRNTLKQVSTLESAVSRRLGKTPRDVIGVYLGWRGGSVDVPGIENITFWDRKQTAHKVGNGGVTEVLARLESIQKTKHAIGTTCGRDGYFTKSRTRLVVIGHSFGGAMVFSGVSQLLQERFVDTVSDYICDAGKRREAATSVTDARGFGNLVVLINPAFEATRFAPLSDMANERRTYFPTQDPLVAVLTSETDEATRVAFPLGRYFSTVFEKHHVVGRKDPVSGAPTDIDQGESNVRTIGHFLPYRTHTLRAEGPAAAAQELDVRKELVYLKGIRDGWEADGPGKAIPFNGSVLKRTANTVSRNPYLVIQVDSELIPDHNKIDDPRIAAFIRELIFLTEL